MDAQALTPHQLAGFSTVERVASVLSLLGCLVVISSFCASKSFHKPINRLVFYASFGNLMTNVATLMARSYIDRPRSPGCQLQAFLIQMFMPADAFWTLAMAVNVYLTFYRKYDAQRLRRIERLYLAVCYGVPFIVALVFVFVHTPARGRMYGNATLWCWLSPDWDVVRIAAFYAPVWVAILVTSFIYIRAGSEIYKKHKQLRDFKYSSRHGEPEVEVEQDMDTDTDMDTDMETDTDAAHVIVTTEIDTAHDSDPDAGHPRADPGDAIDLAPLGRRSPPAAPTATVQDPAAAAYSVTISSNARRSRDRAPLPPQSGRSHAHAATTASATTTSLRSPAAQRLRRRAAYEANSAAWSYTKCALLFFTAMLVTWIPSSANRVFSVVHVGQIALPLEYMSAFVLSLQGFWNAIIYVVTSWEACRMLWEDVRGIRSKSQKGGEDPRPVPARVPSGSDDTDRMATGGRGTSRKSDTSCDNESESVRALAMRS